MADLVRIGGMCDGGGGEEQECGSDVEESDLFLVFVFVLTSFSASAFRSGFQDTRAAELFVSGKRSASERYWRVVKSRKQKRTWRYHQSKQHPQWSRKGLTPQRTLVRAVPEHVRNRVQARESCQDHHQCWKRKTSTVGLTESTRSPFSTMECVGTYSHQGNGELFGEKLKGSKWDSASGNTLCIALHGEAISIMSFAEKACGEWGYKRFAVIETSRGIEVAEAGRCAKAAQKNRTRYGELAVAADDAHDNVQRKSKLMKGTSEEIQNKFVREIVT